MADAGRGRPAGPSPLRDRDAFTLAVAVGIVSGLAEAFTTVLRYAVEHRAAGAIVWNEVYWMAPLAAVTVMLVVAALVCGVGRIPGVRPLAGLVPAVCVGIAVYSYARSQVGGLSPLAVIVLAAGLGAAAARGVARWRVPALRWTRRFAGIAVLGLCVWVAWVPQARGLARRQAVQDLPTAAVEGPNILLIVWDTVRAASLSLYGYARETSPNLDRFAEDAVVFDRAISAAPWTLPSHASLFTGRYPQEHLARRDVPLDDRYPTLPEALSAEGFQTAGFIGNLYWLGRGFGLNRGFQRWEDEWWSPSVEQVAVSWWVTRRLNARMRAQMGSSRAAIRIHADRVEDGFLEWLDGRDPDRPFFGFINLYDAHEPYEPPGGATFGREGARYWWNYQVPDSLTAADLTDLRDTYDSGLYYLDEQLGRLIAGLERRGLLDNTVVILTADHGETLGENDPRVLGHATNMYYDVIHVPLVVRYPARFAPGRREQVVSLVDMPRTVMDLVGLADAESVFPGHSLRPLLEGETGPVPVSPAFSLARPADYHLAHDVWPMSRGPLRSLVVEGEHYVLDAHGGEVLFDVGDSVWEHHDLSDTPEGRALLPDLRARMEAVPGLDEPRVAEVAGGGRTP